MLRDYQTRTLTQLYDWFRANTGNPCIVMPTGSGKSHIVAALCKDALQNYPSTRILMLTHVKELIEQNAEKMRQHWSNAPLGIYSASIGQRDIDAITFAGIQSIRNKAAQLGHIDLCIIDECHLVSHKQEGSYRKLIDALMAINPKMRVVGLTATPFRLGHGLITDKPALFDDLIEPVSIEELIYKKHLAPLRSKVTQLDFDLSQVKKRGGEYVDGDLQRAVNRQDKNIKVVQEIISLAGSRKAWLLFCTGVDHSQKICEILRAHNISSACITGDTPKAEREQMIARFRAGYLKAITNCSVLTTGFDYPDIDLIAMLRPTMSASLYVQMAGRGMRVAPGKTDCMVLDFAGVVSQHGPITAVQPPSKAGSGNGEAPIRVCSECNEICHAAAKACPACGQQFPPPAPKTLKLRGDDDIMGIQAQEMLVQGWQWRTHIGKKSQDEMLAVSYYGGLSDPPVQQYFAITNQNQFVRSRALNELYGIARKANLPDGALGAATLQEMAETLTDGQPPKLVKYKKDGRFFNVLETQW